MKRYLNMVQTFIRWCEFLSGVLNATSIHDHDFTQLPFPTVNEFLTDTRFIIDFNWIISILKLILMRWICHFKNSSIT